MPSPSVVAGVAGGKFFLDAHVDPSGATRRFANDQTGRRALRHGLVRQGVPCVAGEAPDRYHRSLHQGLHAAGIETVVAHPQNARRCAEALGKLAKTDRVDAAMLARLEDFEAAPPAPQKILELQGLEATRRLLAQQREAVGKHLAEVSLEACRRELRAVLRVLARRLQRLQASLAATLAADAVLARRAAPPRRILSRAALSASRCNPPLRAFSQCLRAHGQCAQAALVAGMRKLSVLADTLAPAGPPGERAGPSPGASPRKRPAPGSGAARGVAPRFPRNGRQGPLPGLTANMETARACMRCAAKASTPGSTLAGWRWATQHCATRAVSPRRWPAAHGSRPPAAELIRPPLHRPVTARRPGACSPSCSPASCAC